MTQAPMEGICDTWVELDVMCLSRPVLFPVVLSTEDRTKSPSTALPNTERERAAAEERVHTLLSMPIK